MTRPETFYCKNQYWLSEEMGTELLLFNTKNLVTVLLNSSNALVWKLCAKDVSVEQIVHLLQEQFPKHSDQIELDVIDAIGQLQELELIYPNE